MLALVLSDALSHCLFGRDRWSIWGSSCIYDLGVIQSACLLEADGWRGGPWSDPMSSGRLPDICSQFPAIDEKA